MNGTRQIKPVSSVPQIAISKHVVCQIMRTIGAQAPETGGILLGPIGSSDITDYYFDITAQCTHSTYVPDYLLLRKKMKEEWVPKGIDFKGITHSHPGSFDRLSPGDLYYIGRLLDKNPDIKAFAAPIVIPKEFRLRAIVVLREEPNVQRATTLRIF